MRTAIVQISSILLATLALLMMVGLVGSLLPQTLALGGASSTVIGLVGTAYYGGLAVGGLQVARVLRRVGHIRAFGAFTGVVGVAVLSLALWRHPAAWIAARLAMGVAMGAIYVIIESWLNSTTSTELRGRVLATYNVTVYGGMSLGQLLLAIPDEQGTQRFVVAGLLTCAATIPMALTRTEAPRVAIPHVLELSKLWRLAPLGITTALVGGIATGGVYGVAPAMAASVGMTSGQVANVMLAFILGGIALQWPVGRASDTWDRRYVLGATAALPALAAIPAALLVDDTAAILPLAFCIGGGLASLYAVAVAYTFDRIEPAGAIEANTALILSYCCGSAGGALLASWALGWLGAPGYFALIGLSSGGLAAYAVYRGLTNPPVSDDDKAHAYVLPRTSPMVTVLDPRTEPMTEE